MPTPKLKSTKKAAKELPLVPADHPEFPTVKEQCPPSGGALNGDPPASAPTTPRKEPENPPTHAGVAADLVVTGDKCQPLTAGETQSEQGSPTVNKNVSEIKRLHDETWGHARSSFDNGVRIGELLVAEKKRCGHDHWLAFVRDNLPFDERTARNYMRLFKQKEKVLKSENVSDLILTKAYGLLRKPRQRKPQIAPYGSGIVDVEAHVVQTNSSPGSLTGPADAPSSHDASGAGDAADNKSCSPASQVGVIAEPGSVVADSEPDGDAAEQAPAGSPAQPGDTAADPSAHEAGDQTPPPSPEEDATDQTSVAPAATSGTEVFDDGADAVFEKADGSKHRVAWVHTRALPAEKVVALLLKVKRDNADLGTSYGYDPATLLKFEHRIISTAALVVSQLGGSPTATDLEMVRNALTDIRDLLPTR